MQGGRTETLGFAEGVDTSQKLEPPDAQAVLSLVERMRSGGLADLHTHLLGMGTVVFWRDIVMKQLLPKLACLAESGKVPVEYYPNGGSHVTHMNWSEETDPGVHTAAFHTAKEAEEKKHGLLEYDVVYSLSSLCFAFGIGEDLTQSEQKAKLGKLLRLRAGVSLDTVIKKMLVFNAREQKFEVRTGITNTSFMRLIATKENEQVVQNAFEMVAEGRESPSEHSRMTQFWDNFTPAFHPARYILKDDMYSQYPFVLDALFLHVLDRYRRAGVGYVEFSIGLGDLVTRPWIFKHLARPSLPPDLSGLVPVNSGLVKFRYLAGLSRFYKGMNEALVLTDNPFVSEIAKAVAQKYDDKEAQEWFKPHLDQLRKIRTAFSSSRQGAFSDGLHEMCVGLDYFSDEYRHPHCPFALKDFISFLLEERSKRHGAHFGFRYHCAEYDVATPTKMFLAHMGASSSVIIRILEACCASVTSPPPLRIGHALGFRHYLHLGKPEQFDVHNAFELHQISKALHLMNSMRTPIEVNLTSNHVLQGNAPDAELLKQLLDANFVTVLATDNDGIWRTEQRDPDGREFLSVAGEFYGAIVGTLTRGDYRLSATEVKKIIGCYKASSFGSWDELVNLRQQKQPHIGSDIFFIDTYNETAEVTYMEAHHGTRAIRMIPLELRVDRNGSDRKWSEWRSAVDYAFDPTKNNLSSYHFAGQCPLSLWIYLGTRCKKLTSWTISNCLNNNWDDWKMPHAVQLPMEQTLMVCKTMEAKGKGPLMIFVNTVGHSLTETNLEEIRGCLGNISPCAIECLEPRQANVFLKADQFSQFSAELDGFLEAIAMKHNSTLPLVVATTGPAQVAFLLGTKNLLNAAVREIIILDHVMRKYQVAFRL